MIPFFPKAIANKGLTLYLISLMLVSVAFMSYAMGLVWIILGLVEVSVFFMLSNLLSMKWGVLSDKQFVKNVFWVAFGLRMAWVIFSYFFYLNQTGQPFEFGAADSLGYHDEATWLTTEPWGKVFDYLFISRNGYSDSGYPLYLTFVYKVIGPNILVARMLKVLWSSWMCVLLYKLASRNMEEKVARMVGLFAVLMPNLIIYCGLHLKETEMLLLVVAFLERADYVMKSKKFNFVNIALPILLAFSLFLFRTVLGAVALFSFMTALLFSPNNVVKKGRKVMIAFWVILAVVVLAGSIIMNEMEELWLNRNSNQENKRMEQTSRGNQWAKYATGTVMAPMMFVLPFSTMVDTDQENQMVMHGGNYVRNYMGAFVMIALFSVLFVKKNWRDFALIGSFVIAYLGVISLSGFANSERFLLPGLPCLIIIWAYGISILDAKSYKYVKYWYVVVPIMEIGWAYFKIGSRGLF
ncbi:MAG: hypothetical protein IKT08_00495 [Bacteroidales bacterium]|nr:hypothetical protein [Bacteroidales bacterium]